MSKKFELDGFYLGEKRRGLKNVGELSLQISIYSYISTYHAVGGNELSCYMKRMRNNIDHPKYVELAYESILHFQHFIELYIKEILKNIHPILAINSSKKHLLTYQLLFKEAHSEDDVEKSNQLEFSEALARFFELFKKGKIDSKYQFIKDAKDWIEQVNWLRNRISHRGIFILKYESLDELFGNFILPFISDLFANDSSFNRDYYFKKTVLDISPLDEIINIFKSDSYELKTISLLKEMCRAIYNDPIEKHPFFKHLNDENIEKAEAMADYYINKKYNNQEKVNCPICGIESLILFMDTVFENEDEDGNTTSAYIYVYNATCCNCGFNIDNQLYDKSMKFINLEDIFKSEEL